MIYLNIKITHFSNVLKAELYSFAIIQTLSKYHAATVPKSLIRNLASLRKIKQWNSQK